MKNKSKFNTHTFLMGLDALQAMIFTQSLTIKWMAIVNQVCFPQSLKCDIDAFGRDERVSLIYK